MRRLIALVMAGLMALMPMSVLAGPSSSPADAQEMPCHSGGGDQPQDLCGDLHKCCASVLTPAVPALFSLPASAGRTPAARKLHAGFVPAPLDPPPVAL